MSSAVRLSSEFTSLHSCTLCSPFFTRSQSTVSRHLRLLADEGYVFLRPDGVRTLVTVNVECMVDLPAAAAEIMGAAGFAGTTEDG